NGAAGSFASSLAGTNTYFCRMMGNSFSPCLGPNSGAGTGTSYNAPGAGYPINFFRLNPYTSSMNYVNNLGWWSYNGLQVQLRKALSNGLTVTANYSLSHGMSNTGADNSNNQQNWLTLRNESLDRRPSIFDQRHTISGYATYDLPIGKGKKIDLQPKWLDLVAGGWTTGQIVQFATGTPTQIGGSYATFNNFFNSGVQLAPGVSLSEFSDVLHNTTLQKINQAGGAPQVNRGNVTDLQRLGVPASWVASDGRANQQFITWDTTPGTMGQLLFIPNVHTWAWNMSLSKTYHVT